MNIKKTYKSEVTAGLNRMGSLKPAILSENEIQHLPPLIIKKKYPWSMHVSEYKNYNGMRMPAKALTIYHRPDNDFCYGEFELVSVEYNCNE